MAPAEAATHMVISRVICVALLLAAISAAGCGVSQAKLDEAKSAVQEGLEVWKKGGKSADLSSQARPIEFHDGLWSAGVRLLSYEMVKTAYDSRDQVIRCEARLTIRERTGRQKTEIVAYDVKLESPVKVVNNPMP